MTRMNDPRPVAKEYETLERLAGRRLDLGPYPFTATRRYRVWIADR